MVEDSTLCGASVGVVTAAPLIIVTVVLEATAEAVSGCWPRMRGMSTPATSGVMSRVAAITIIASSPSGSDTTDF